MTLPKRKRAMALAATAVAVALVSAGCGGSDSSTTQSDGESSDGAAQAQAAVDKFAANPALEISPLAERPDAASVININCTLAVCAPNALKPAMDALGWKFTEMGFDITKGPAAVQPVLKQAIAANPDVIVMPGALPLEAFQSQVDAAVKKGIKFIDVGSDELPPNYAACIQCKPSSTALGVLAGDIVLADAGGKTEVAVAVDKTVGSLVNESKGVKQELEKLAAGSKVEELEQSITSTPADNASRIVSSLQRNPNVKYLVLTSPQFNPAAALKSAGLGSRVKIVGAYPVSASDVAAAKDGQVIGWAAGEVASMWWRVADTAVRLASDVELDSTTPVNSMRVINKSNADISLVDPPKFEDVYKSAWKVQ